MFRFSVCSLSSCSINSHLLNRRMDRMREMSQEQLDQKKREAEDAIELMRESYAKRVQQELDTKGIVPMGESIFMYGF